MAIDKVVDSAVLDGYFSDIADAIRAKGASGTYTPAQMPQAIEDLPASDPNLMALLAGTAIGDVIVRDVDFSATCLVLNYFSSATPPGVASLSLPDATRIFKLICSSSYTPLEVLNIPKCVRTEIHNADNSNSQNVFTYLREINAPVLTNLGGLLRNTKLTDFELPELQYAPLMFYNNMLQRIRLPKLTSWTKSQQFGFNSALKTVDLGASTTGQLIIANETFRADTALEALVLRYPTVATLNRTNAFDNTPIASGTGYIYVPRDLISTYEAATNWSTYAGQFRAIEDYTDDGTIDGEFIMPT